MPERELPAVLWLWAVPLPFAVHLASHLLDGGGRFFATWVESESGFIENGTAFMLLPAAILALQAARRLRRPAPVAGLWFIGIALLCVAFSGEEISWGQHWFGWSSPEFFAGHNRQGETNFHNLNIHLGRVVKAVVTLGIIVGGIVVPLWPARGHAPRARWILPTIVCLPAAAFVAGIRVIERLKTWLHLDWQILAVNLKESQEFYIALFFLLYTWSARARLGALPAGSER